MHAVRNWLTGGILMMALTMAPANGFAKAVPDTISLDALVQLYDAVKFDHSKHINLVKDCEQCHHHTTGTLVTDKNCVRCHKNSGATAVVACRGCHAVQTFSAEALRGKDRNTYHMDKLSLKGAYHQGCTGCHKKSGGPTGCQDCHALKNTGEAFYNSGSSAPKQANKADKHGGH
jgi:hypothetical protein